MRIGFLLACLMFVSVVFMASSMSIGCTAETATPDGGETHADAAAEAAPDAAAEAAPDAAAEAAEMVTASAEGGEGGSATTNNPATDCQQGGTYGGNTWTDLYQCYFGPTGPDSCAGSAGNCHGTGGAGTAYWTCGEDAGTCYSGMKAFSTIDPTLDTSDPTMNGLYVVLCKTDGSGLMPLGCPPSAQLYPDDMARIAAWIQAGGTEN